MQVTLASMLAAGGFTSLVAAAPLETRQSTCSAYPWFIGPHTSGDCSGSPPYYQPTSGPIANPPNNVYCSSIYNPSGAPQSFASVAINRDACSDQIWTIKLYTDADCQSQPTIVNSDTCVPAPAGQGWLKFDAVIFEAN